MTKNENRADYFFYFLFTLTRRQFGLYLYLTEKKVQGIRGTSLLPLDSGRLITREYRKTLMAV